MHNHPSHVVELLRRTALCAFALSATACDAITSPSSSEKAVSFSVAIAEKPASVAALRAAGASSASAVADGPLVIAVGNDTLVIDSVRVVLAQVVLARAGDDACGTAGHDDASDSECASLNTGPFIAKLPLTAGALSLFDVPVPKGVYSAVAVRVHKPNRLDSGPNVQAFLDAHPDWENKSIKVAGSFNGVPVHWSHDPVAQLEHTFEPPIVVDSAANFTLKIDVASWFRAANGSLIDPNAKTDALYPQIATNVKNSFSLFRDEQKDGHNDDQ